MKSHCDESDRARSAGRLVLSVFFLLLMLQISMPHKARGWEFSATGQFACTFEHYSLFPGGSRFFGPVPADAQFGGRLSSVTSYLGHRLASTTASGINGSTNWQTLDVDTELRINQALRLRGHYRLGDCLDCRRAWEYRTATRPGTWVALSSGQWTQWWTGLQMPWGIIVAGKRPKAFGLGLNSNGYGGDTTTETAMLRVPQGPFSFGIGLYWSRRDHFSRRNPNDLVAYEIPDLPINTEYFVNRFDQVYWNPDDRNNIQPINVEAFWTYAAGPLEIGMEVDYFMSHRGAEGELAPPGLKTTITRDQVSVTYDLYMKLTTGRFFLNTELVVDDTTTRFQRNPNAAPNGNDGSDNDGRGSRFATKYVESWRYMVETGSYSGPAKLSLLYAWLPGADRRNGVVINKQGLIPKTGYGVFAPYSFLLGYAYGAGINAFDFNRYGYLNDARVMAVRFDYAVAANLNVFATFLKANRAGHGYGWGFIDLDGREFIDSLDGARVGPLPVQVRNSNYGQVLFRFAEQRADAFERRLINAIAVDAPNIPDTDLGWEFTTGLSWELIQGQIMSSRFAYWQPGKWFNYACIDKSVANRGAPNWGVNPDRDLTSVFAFSLSWLTTF